jgi:hypothetical protein
MMVLALLASANAAQADPGVAQVTGVKGTVQVGGQACKIFARLQSGDTVDVSSGAQITLFFYGDNHREQIAGPAKFSVKPSGADLPAAKKVVTQAPGALKVAGGSVAGLNSDQYGGSVKRGGGDEELHFTTGHSASRTPRLHWTELNGATAYRVDVQTGPAAPPVISEVVKDTSFLVKQPLDAGKTYYCTVTALDEDQAQVGRSVGTLDVAPEATLARLATQRQQFDNAVQGTEDPALYLTMAAAYTEAGLTWDAIDILKQLAARVPQSGFPHERLAAMYSGLGMQKEAALETKQAETLGN